MHCAQCTICNTKAGTFLCRGCSKDYCFKHLTEHRQILDEQFHDILNNYNQFKQTIIEQKQNPNTRLMIQEIHQWKNESIQKIEQLAKECEEKVIKYTNGFLNRLENHLNETIRSVDINNEQNQFNEIDLTKLEGKLNELKMMLNKPKNISIEQQSTSFIDRITVHISIDKGKNRINFYRK